MRLISKRMDAGLEEWRVQGRTPAGACNPPSTFPKPTAGQPKRVQVRRTDTRRVVQKAAIVVRVWEWTGRRVGDVGRAACERMVNAALLLYVNPPTRLLMIYSEMRAMISLSRKMWYSCNRKQARLRGQPLDRSRHPSRRR